jgi:hypothetical protein
LASVMRDDRQILEQPQADGRHDEHIDGTDVRSIIPALRRWPRRRTLYLATVDWATSKPNLSSSRYAVPPVPISWEASTVLANAPVHRRSPTHTIADARRLGSDDPGSQPAVGSANIDLASDAGGRRTVTGPIRARILPGFTLGQRARAAKNMLT